MPGAIRPCRFLFTERPVRWIVLIVDDHPLVGQAFEVAIGGAYPQYEVGLVATAAEAEAFAAKHASRIKVVMLDLMLPDADGFSALINLQHRLPDARFAMVSARADRHSIAMARAFGVSAYLSKTAPVETLINSVGAVMRGEEVFPDEIVADPVAADFHRRVAKLSTAQLRIMRSLVDGKLNKQIAGEMNITEGTVKQHVSAIFKKLDVHNRSQAILAAAPILGAEGWKRSA